MPDFACPSLSSPVQSPIHDGRAADSSVRDYVEHVANPPAGPIQVLTECSSVGVVVQHHRQMKLFFYEVPDP
jgi:hypothetical protein